MLYLMMLSAAYHYMPWNDSMTMND